MNRLLQVAALFGLIWPQAGFAQSVTTFEDIDFWVGSGTNQAALVIDWDGESNADQALAWGYRWDSGAVGADMLFDIVVADPRLYARLAVLGGFGNAVNGVGYDANDDGQFEVTGGTRFDQDGLLQSPNTSDGETSTDAEDLYAEGWVFGFWHIGTATASPFADGSWGTAGTGIDTLQLADAMWVSLAFTTDTFSNSEFAENPIAASAPAVSTDFNQDSDVDGHDFLTWQTGFGDVGEAAFNLGDANLDGRIDAVDLGHWQSGYGQVGNPLLSNTLAVPEPSVTALLVSFVFSFHLRGRRVS